jgi:prepilin-type N-terminal cleavage/methylation domain-containing protein
MLMKNKILFTIKKGGIRSFLKAFLNNYKTRFKGFSLIELSIVLIIMGLLIAGIVGGSALIMNAKVIGAAREMNKYVMAATMFRGKYQELPGLLQDATKRWSTAKNTTSTTGFINPNNDLLDQDSFSFFQQLYLDELLDDEGPYLGKDSSITSVSKITKNHYPFSKFWKGMFYYVRGDLVGGSYERANRLSLSDGKEEIDGGFDAKVLYMIDVKLDDGLPLTGFVSIVPTEVSESE